MTSPGPPSAQFRPGGVRVLAVGWWVIAALLALDLLLRGGSGAAAAGVPLLALSCAVVHALFWYPAVVVDDDGVDLVNVARSVRLPWSVVEDVDTRWALSLDAGGRRWTSWAAPASGRRIRPVSRRDTPWAERGAEGIAGSRAPGSSAGEAAVMVETRLQAWRDRPRPVPSGPGSSGPDPSGPDPSGPFPSGTRVAGPVVRWNVGVLAPVGATALLTVVGAAWALLG